MFTNLQSKNILEMKPMRFIKNTITFLAFSTLFVAQANAGLNIQHWQTPQGSEVYFVENHDLPIIDLSVNFDAGNARDEVAKAGLAGVTKYMMSLGAAGLSEEQISKQLADVGANLGGNIDSDIATFKLRTLSSTRERDQALDIFTKILQQPDFPANALSREKSRIIAGLKESATQPESISNRAFMKALYPNHPYSINAEPETVALIQREDLQKFYATYYGAKGAVIAVIGDMSRAEAAKLAERIASGLPQVAAPAPLPAVTYPEQAREVRIAHPASQSHILLGYPGVKRGDPDFFALYVGNYVLGGGGFVSRLTEEVREKRGLVYSVYSYFMPMTQIGPFQIGLQTKREQAEQALKVVNETLDKFMQGGISDKELVAAKQNITGGFPLRLDSNAKILDYLAVIGFYHLPLTYLDDFNKNINAVTKAQVKDAFNRRIDTKKMVTIVVGGNGGN
jgi:zinc protease